MIFNEWKWFGGAFRYISIVPIVVNFSRGHTAVTSTHHPLFSCSIYKCTRLTHSLIHSLLHSRKRERENQAHWQPYNLQMSGGKQRLSLIHHRQLNQLNQSLISQMLTISHPNQIHHHPAHKAGYISHKTKDSISMVNDACDSAYIHTTCIYYMSVCVLASHIFRLYDFSNSPSFNFRVKFPLLLFYTIFMFVWLYFFQLYNFSNIYNYMFRIE